MYEVTQWTVIWYWFYYTHEYGMRTDVGIRIGYNGVNQNYSKNKKILC